MKIELYKDGIGFFQDDEEYIEIAFYSNITNRVTYNINNGYDAKTFGFSSLPYEDNKKIMDEIKRYKRSLEAGL